MNTGASLAGAVDDDLLGTVRPIGLQWDIGCYELPLLGLWELNEGSGTLAADTSGNGNDGTLNNGTSWNSTSCRTSVRFNGGSGYIDLDEQVALQFTDEFSLVARVKFDVAGHRTGPRSPAPVPRPT